MIECERARSCTMTVLFAQVVGSRILGSTLFSRHGYPHD